MVTLSTKSSIKIALRLASILAMASTAEGQTSNVPKRRRATQDRRLGKENFPTIEQLEYSMSAPSGGRMRSLEDLSMPLEELDLSTPLRPGLRMMSLPLEQSDFEMSLPLQQSEISMPLEELEMSVPLEELELSMPADAAGDESTAGAVALDGGEESGGNGTVLASFLAAFSMLVAGLAAFFVGIVRRRRPAEESVEEVAEASGGREQEDVSVVSSLASSSDLNGDLDSPNEGGDLGSPNEGGDLDSLNGGTREVDLV